MATATKKARSPHQPTGQWIRSDKRLAIYLRDRFTCIYCLKDMHDAAPTDITLDHVIPKSDGGSNAETNLVTACRACNCSRQDKPLARFAGPEARKQVKRNTGRCLKKYVVLARALQSGETGFEETLNSL